MSTNPIITKKLSEFQVERTNALSEMFDTVRADGIYATSKLFQRLDAAFTQALEEAYSAGEDEGTLTARAHYYDLVRTEAQQETAKEILDFLNDQRAGTCDLCRDKVSNWNCRQHAVISTTKFISSKYLPEQKPNVISGTVTLTSDMPTFDDDGNLVKATDFEGWGTEQKPNQEAA